MATKKKPEEKKVTLAPIEIGEFEVTIVGKSPLIVHQFGSKNRIAIKDKQEQVGSKKGTRAARKPEDEYEESLYYTNDGKYGFPATGVKKACVSACTSMGKAIPKTLMRQALHIYGLKDPGMIEIKGEPRMRTDIVRLPNKSADLRYRPCFDKWSATFKVIYNAAAISAEQILNFLELAGFGVGLGDWRPERDGPFGLFGVQTEAKKKRAKKS